MKENRNIFIMGDSYSTYTGYIPEGYNSYYGDNRKDNPIVNGVDKTWWRILANENNLNIVLNDSYSGSTVCNTVREGFKLDTSFINRIDKYIADGFFAENDIDTMFIFGGTNDSWIDAPIGNVKYSDRTDEDLKCVLPAFCHLIERAKTVVKNIVVIINSDLKPSITAGFAEACKNYDVACLHLENIDKENGHPTVTGMKQISEQVEKCL
jgi:hypothetical protein